MSTIATIGVDIAKTSFAVHGFDVEDRTVLAKTLKRPQVLDFFAKLGACRVGLEACASAHHWAREIAKLDHEAELVPAQRVKAFLPRMKNVAADAKAIARAVRDPEMRFVAMKSIAQQAALMLFKSRDLLVAQHTALLNALRGHFGEVGVVVPRGATLTRIDTTGPDIAQNCLAVHGCEDGENTLHAKSLTRSPNRRFLRAG